MTTKRFYDELAPWHHLVYADWEASMERQAMVVDAVLQSAFPERPRSSVRVLDVAAGIGTQALPLAARGYVVTARDLSPVATARLTAEAARRRLRIDTAVADMRSVSNTVTGPFDAVIALDNALPHLLSDAEILEALRDFRGVLRADGRLLVSLRDYATVDRSLESAHPYGERLWSGRRIRSRQEWQWTDPDRYRTTFIWEEMEDGQWIERVRTSAMYYAIDVSRVAELLIEAGFAVCERRDDFFQPLLVARGGA